MLKVNRWMCILAVVLSAACTQPFPDETKETPGPIKLRVTRQYRTGNEYYLFDSLDPRTREWRRVFQVWRDATGKMPDAQNLRSITTQVAYMYLVDQAAITHDAGANWTVFNASKYFNCGWEGCAVIVDVKLAPMGEGSLSGSRRSGKEWLDFTLITNDFGRTWRASPK